MKPLLLLVLAACEPPLDQRLAIVTEPSVLAITSDPAEALPGAAVTYGALLASPDGPLAVTPSWALCTAPKPPTEDNVVSNACLTDAALVDLGAAATVATTLPTDACIQFGPDVPGMGFRPRDPDSTGGYFQPVRADAAPAELAFGFSRITCNLANAPSALAEQFLLDYVANVNPTLLPLALSVDANAVAAGATVTLTASWPASAVESYLYFDQPSQTLVTRSEAMRVSWYATGGSMAVDASAVAEGDPATSVSTTWIAPTTTGPAWLWLVLRDSRGGIATQTIPITIE